MKSTYIEAAKKACAYVHTICPLGSANRANGEKYNTMAAAAEALRREKSDCDDKINTTLSDSSQSDDEKHFDIIQLLANIAIKSKAGNCQEMAALAFLKLKEQGIRPIELVSIPIHTFILIGRDPKTDINNPSSWNSIMPLVF
jgi:hypothetical protein